MADYQLDAYASRFFKTTLRPLANVLLGTDATIDVGTAEWIKILADLNTAGVADGDALVTDDAPVDGTGSPTFAQVKSVITLLAAIGPLIKADVTPLSILHTKITLPD